MISNPDDGTYLRSWLGPQADSRKDNAPAFGFGSGDRSGAFVNPSSRAVGLSPGPIYRPSPRGVCGDGPKFSFGSGASAAAAARRAGAAPGPGEYEMPPAIGASQAASTNKSAPQYGWGSSGREKAPVGLAPRPACNEFYELTEAVGQQPISTKKTQAAYSLSHSARFDDRSVLRARAAAPGPGSYRSIAGTGAQVDSTRHSQPAYSWSRSERFRGHGTGAANANGSQGPRSACGSQVLSERRSKPSFGFGTAQRFPDRPTSALARSPGPGTYNA